MKKLVCFTFLVGLLVANLIYRNEHINNEKNQQLSQFIIDVKNDEKINKIFHQKITIFLSDNKISNAEFDSLEKLYEKYKTAKAVNDTNFVDKVQKEIDIAQQVEKGVNLMILLGSVVFFLLLGLVLFPLRRKRRKMVQS